MASKKTTYGNGTMLQSLAEKLGSILVVWCAKDNGWQRMTFAARFDSRTLGCKARRGDTIVLVLRNEHYTLLQCPAKTHIPQAWCRETASTLFDLTGGGDEASRGTPSVYTARTSAQLTPSVHTVDGRPGQQSPGQRSIQVSLASAFSLGVRMRLQYKQPAPDQRSWKRPATWSQGTGESGGGRPATHIRSGGVPASRPRSKTRYRLSSTNGLMASAPLRTPLR